MQGLSTRPPLFWNYARYSTPPQQWGDSDRRQLVEGRHRAAALRMTFVDSYRDLGISAYHSRNRTNGALGQFLADLRSPPRADPWPMPGDVLHCENFDRLSRADPEDSLKLFMEIIESGIILMVRDQQYTRDVMRRERWRWQQVLSELIRAHEESFWKSRRRGGVAGRAKSRIADVAVECFECRWSRDLEHLCERSAFGDVCGCKLATPTLS
jgi:DNA invertase Pin-like site-specific DNA recombinase